jgi:hypothetical protein
VETNNLRRAGLVELIVHIDCSNGALVSIVQCSDQPLATVTVLASSLLDLGEDGLARVDLSRFRDSEDPQ